HLVMTERPYTAEDFAGLKKADLINLVVRQQGKWPGKFRKSSVKVDELKDALLEPRNHFTTNLPPRAATQYSSNPIPVVPNGPPPAESRSRASESARSSSTARLSSNPIPAETEQIPPSTTRQVKIRVYVQDFRHTPALKTLAFVMMEVPTHTVQDTGSFEVSAPLLLSQLQMSAGAIQFRAPSERIRLSFPDSEDPEYMVPFAHIESGASVENTVFNPDKLSVSAMGHVHLNVDNTSTLQDIFGKPRPMHSTTSPVSSTQLATKGTSNSEEEQTSSVVSSSLPCRQEVQYLRDILDKRNGFKAFASHRNHVVQNSEIVHDWKFVDAFCSQYKSVRVGTLKVRSDDIWNALGVKKTWLSNARNAARIIR
ncbi:unnamed protein product, partial [Mycena citricolor]